MKLAIVVSRYNKLPTEVAEVLRKFDLEPKYIEIPERDRGFRTDAKTAYMEVIQELQLLLEEGMAVVRLDDTIGSAVLAQGLRSAIIQLTTDLRLDAPPSVDPIMISFSRGQVVVVMGSWPYPIPA